MTEHTPGPWVQFVDQGKCIAIMPAMREGDVCTFKQSPSDADAFLITAAPALLEALTELSKMYTHAWDRIDGGLSMFGASIDRFEKAHFAAEVALALAAGAPPPIYFDDEEERK